ncbi:MAG: hypothetical protein GXP55_15745, partial [Deltaproteobacteria bacterium]|nr:hypothetical protein [Deltaproteobacteria bacterium]
MTRGIRLGQTLALAAAGVLLFVPSVADAQQTSFGNNPIVSMVVLGALSLLPFLFMTTTSFVKISVVFSILRNALGTGQVPSGLVITSLSVLLTLYVMAPVGEQIQEAAAPAAARVDLNHPLEGESFDALVETFRLGVEPVRGFLRRNAGARETRLFWNLARHVRAPEHRGDVGRDDLLVLLPSFLITELTEAFQIGF